MGLKDNKRRHAGVRGGMTVYLFQHLLLAMFEPARSDDDIETEIFTITFFSSFLSIFLADCAPEPWIQIAFVTEPSLEERANAFDVTIEVPSIAGLVLVLELSMPRTRFGDHHEATHHSAFV